MNSLIRKIKNNFKYYWVISTAVTFFLTILSYFRFSPRKLYKDLTWYYQDYRKFSRLKKNPNFNTPAKYYYPCLTDKTDSHEIEPIYFYQNSWAAKKIFDLKSKSHVDVGSSATAIALISQHVPTTMVDIRPLTVKLDGLNFVKGSILKLPFKSNSLETVSSICVLEHIGLGRYGDKLDQFGSEKAAKELSRVVRRGGHLIVSVPVDQTNRVYFNAHRAFTPAYFISQFPGFKLVEECYIYGNQMYPKYSAERGFGTGLYLLKKK